MSRASSRILGSREPLRLGFMPVTDCAPLVYAQEAGLFEKYDLDVELQRESSWANIRDKIIEGGLDAAQAPCTLPFLANLGLESDPCACVSGMVLSLQGNGIAISRELWEEGLRDAEMLRERIYRNWRTRTYTFAVVSEFSPQHILLRHWLRRAGIVPEAEIRLVVLPPEQMFPTLKLGYIDGFCVNEPWTSVAVQAGVAVCMAISAELMPLHPEKVLMVRQSFATGRAEEHERLLAALMEACVFCDLFDSRDLMSDVLAHRDYVNAPPEALRAGLLGPFESHGFPIQEPLRLNIFHRDNANEPSDDKAAWVMTNLYEALGQRAVKFSPEGRSPVLKNVFRRDIFARAKALVGKEQVAIEPQSCGDDGMISQGG